MTEREMYKVLDEIVEEKIEAGADFQTEPFCAECPFKEYCSKHQNFIYGCGIWEMAQGEDL